MTRNVTSDLYDHGPPCVGGRSRAQAQVTDDEEEEQGIQILSATGKEKMTKKTERMKYRCGSRLFQLKLLSACSTSSPGSKRVRRAVRVLKFSHIWKIHKERGYKQQYKQ